MSIGTVGKLLRCLAASAFIGLAMPGSSWAQACASCGTCATGQCCQSFHCPPAYVHCQEGPPHICFKCGCPHPVCNPCELPHWGYFETCWTPYPYPPDWSHCPTPPPAALVTLNPLAPRGQGMPGATIPDPRQPQRVPNVLPPAGSPYSAPGVGNPSLPQPRTQPSGL